MSDYSPAPNDPRAQVATARLTGPAIQDRVNAGVEWSLVRFRPEVG